MIPFLYRITNGFVPFLNNSIKNIGESEHYVILSTGLKVSSWELRIKYQMLVVL
jgi:hypothetical protein